MAALTIQKEQRTAQYFREKLGNAILLDMILVHGGNTKTQRRGNR